MRKVSLDASLQSKASNLAQLESAETLLVATMLHHAKS